MKFSKKLKYSLLLICIAVLMLASTIVYADNTIQPRTTESEAEVAPISADVSTTNSVSSNNVTNDLYLHDSSVTIDYPVTGNVFILANDVNIRNSRKKSMERKELKNLKNEEATNANAKNYAKKIKNEQYEQQQENLRERYQNLQYKFEKLEEFTEQKDVGSFCEKFKKNAQKNFDLFVTITMISSEAKKLESEIKEIEEEINGFKKYKNSQQGIERHTIISELKTKTQKLIQKQDKYENDYKKYNEEFRQLKNKIQILYSTLKCEDNLTDEERIEFSNGITEGNAIKILSKIEGKLKYCQRVLEYEKNLTNEDNSGMNNEPARATMNPKQVNDNMKMAFASMDISKIKSMEKIKSDHKSDDFKFDNLKMYSEKVADELMENIIRANQNEKKEKNKLQKRAKLN